MAMIHWGSVSAASDKTMATITRTAGTEFRAALEDLLEDVAAAIIAGNPAIIEAAEQAVADALAREIRDANLVSAYPKTPTRYTTFPSIPMKWRYTPYTDPYSDTYEDEYVANFSDAGVSYGDVPILRPDGTLDASVIPDGFATEAYVDDAIAAIEPTPPVENLDAPDLRLPSVLWARVDSAKAAGEPVAVVFTGSSTTRGIPGYVGGTVAAMQSVLWPEVEPSETEWEQNALFTEKTTPGLHGYSAGHGGTTAATYLTHEEMDRIAALRPAIILHMVGSNDYAQQRNPDTYKADIEGVLAYFDSILTSPVQHVLVHAYAIPKFRPWSHPHAAYGRALKDIATARADSIFLNLAPEYARVGIPGDDPLNLIGDDNVHQTDAGYAFMQRLVSFFFTRSLTH